MLTPNSLPSPTTISDSLRQSEPCAQDPRPVIRGKFLSIGGKKFYVRGVTYGTFRPNEHGAEHYDPAVVNRDFVQMRGAGINAIRTYTVPPLWFLDLARQHGLYVMVGLPWEQHVAFLDERHRAKEIEKRVRTAVRSCAGHPAILCFTIGNEIPSGIVRWLGPQRIERFLRRLYRAVKDEDPGALVTYVNYPSTEYLDLPFIDFFCFNVYLESEETLDSYLARLQNLAGDRPLVMAEIGLDSRRNGVEVQAETLEWQVRAVFAAGGAGAFIFAWTDEWWRGGYDIEDWDFGLVTRERTPKPALTAISRAFAEIPFPQATRWPPISVVVCTHNGSRTLRDCMDGLMELDYPNFEVIVVNDGSTDNTAEIVSEYNFKLISTENRGLGSARNTGMYAARGEIVAYTDDDARPDPHWLQYLAQTFLKGTLAGVGGPNIAPAGDGWIADCVANSPGGPVHVLVSDQVAEHIPGCNMAFRRDALLAIGGCDPIYRVAGDDVDLCWRIQQNGGVLGFSPAAMVWHHRRNSARMYWRQQHGYGKAEALLEGKWPEKYNSAGHLTWAGKLYGRGLTEGLFFSRRVYHGQWGTALFQSIYERAPGSFSSLPLMPEWYLLIASLGIMSMFGIFWKPLLLAAPFFVATLTALVVQAIRSANRAHFTSDPKTKWTRFSCWSLTAAFHVLQPLARLRGRIRFGLTPWRRRAFSGWRFPVPRLVTIWSEQWRSPEDRIHSIEGKLREAGACVLSGGDFDRWDLAVRSGLFGSARLLTAVEEHGAGKQLTRVKLWPSCSPNALLPGVAFAVISASAALAGVWLAAAVLLVIPVLLVFRCLAECSLATAAILRAIQGCQEPEEVEATIIEEPPIIELPATEPIILEPLVAAAAVGARHTMAIRLSELHQPAFGNGNGNGLHGNGKGHNGGKEGNGNGRRSNGHNGNKGHGGNGSNGQLSNTSSDSHTLAAP